MPSRRIGSTIRQNLIRLDHQLRREILDELNDAGDTMKREFKKVTSDWRHKPKFNTFTEIGRKQIVLTVIPEKFGMAANIWRWVDAGTGRYGKRKSAYPIRPKRTNPTQTLRFRTGYSPKTAPVAKYNQGTGSASGPWVSKKEVMHPGIKPRKFTITISNKLKPPLTVRIERAIARAIRRAAR